MHPRPSRTRSRIAVLVSGGGSNLQALIDYLDSRGDERAGDVAIVISNRPGAGALSRAAARGIESAVVAGAAGDATMLSLLDRASVDLVVLAGYLRLVPPEVIARFRGRILNVHPALLPAFGGRGMYGHHVHAAVIASGTTISGPTVHFVDEEFDRGPIIAQWPVPVRHDDTAETLAARVLRAEHLLLPRTVDAVARGAIALDATGRVVRPVPSHEFDGFVLGGERTRTIASIEAIFGDGARTMDHH